MFNKTKVQPKLIFSLVVAIWIVFSIIYIGKDMWSDFKMGFLNQAYQAGRTETINQLMTQAENPSCQPFSVFNDQKQIQVINVACLTATQPNANISSTEGK